MKKTNEQKDFGGFSQKARPDLSLVDEIQFHEAEGAVNILYPSSCRFEQKEVSNSGYRANPKTAPFFSFLNPEQLRLLGESKEGAQCAFDFVALNPNGSKHYFKLPLVQLMDDVSAAELELFHPKTTEPFYEISFEQWPEYFLKLAKSGASQIVISCASGSKTISINQQDRLNLSSVPLQEMALNWDLGAQSCRISQLQNSIVVAISKNIVLLSPALNAELKGTIVQHPLQTWAKAFPYLESATYRIEIINPDSRPIRIRIPKQNLEFTVNVSHHRFAGYMLAQSDDKKANYEWTPDKVITVGPKQTFVAYHYARIDKDNCPAMYKSPLHNPNSITIELISEKLSQKEEKVLKQFVIKPYSVPIYTGPIHQDIIDQCSAG